ncbi:hypothetical protein CP675_09945 [Escherichia coli]|nr:hypothetical protein CP675_09945 [Escherichia coli]
MDCTINRISINVFKVPFFSGIFILDDTVTTKPDKPVLIAFVFDENGVLPAVFVLNKEFYIGTVTTRTAIFRKIGVQGVIYLAVKWCLLQPVIKPVRFKP